MRYRPEIDGLRAIAILPVILFHADLSYFGGGFIGVDIFFVISGYLITSLIWPEIQEGRFSLVNFYERRARRLFPALFTVLFVCAVVSYLLLLPGELRDFGQSIFSTAIFSSNFLFWWEAGYFDAEGELKPLLHTWSLAVEEQYYALFPLLLLISVSWWSRARLAMILVLAAISFCVSTLTLVDHPDASFYLLTSRFWELLLGALLALMGIRSSSKRATNELIGWAGIIMIMYVIAAYDSTTLFPGKNAIAPCIGTAMIIVSTMDSRTILHNLLSTKGLVLIGLLSYSLYLWHWPVLIFSKMILDRPLVTYEAILLLLVSTAVAWCSWKFVEGPFRDKRKFGRRKIFSTSLVAIALCLVIGSTMHLTNGFPNRLDSDTLLVVKFLENETYGCLFTGTETERLNFDSPNCTNGPTQSDRYLLWGDSHAGSLSEGFRERKIGLTLLSMQGCPPLIGVDVGAKSGTFSSRCRNFNDDVIQWIGTRPSIEFVILSAHWSLYFEGLRLATDPNRGRIWLSDSSERKNVEVAGDSLARLVSKLDELGKKVILIGPVPELRINGASSIGRRLLTGNDNDFHFSRAEVDGRLKSSVDTMERLANEFSFVDIVRVDDLFCGNERCETMIGKLPLYTDRHHVSRAGAELVVKSGVIRYLADK